MSWFKKKELCVHCKKNKTRRDFEGEPTCADCRVRIQVEREASVVCPKDGTLLLKEASGEIILDRCPTCQGVWLDAGELKAIKEAANEEGVGAGMALGMVIN